MEFIVETPRSRECPRFKKSAAPPEVSSSRRHSVSAAPRVPPRSLAVLAHQRHVLAVNGHDAQEALERRRVSSPLNAMEEAPPRYMRQRLALNIGAARPAIAKVHTPACQQPRHQEFASMLCAARDTLRASPHRRHGPSRPHCPPCLDVRDAGIEERAVIRAALFDSVKMQKI